LLSKSLSKQVPMNAPAGTFALLALM
jgi:hypothetical protein